MKAKGFKFFASSSIPGISRIFTTKNYVFKVLWTLLILISVVWGFVVISESVDEFYKYDVITNTERVTPDNFVFPAITFCTQNMLYRLTSLSNGTLTQTIAYKKFNIANFIIQVSFIGIDLNMSHLESFQNPDTKSQCFRFNGGINGRRLETINNTEYNLTITVKNSILQYSSKEAKVVDFFPPSEIFISDNYLNSFYKQIPLRTGLPNPNGANTVDRKIIIAKATIERKLGEPYSRCKNLSSTGERYHQMNCIDGCIHREIGHKYNCTFGDGLFAIGDLNECSQSITEYRDEFYKGCEVECPVGCDWTEFSKILERGEANSGKPNFVPRTRFILSIAEFSSLEIKQIPKMTVFSFISNVGGSLGLFMGVSFLSFVELIEFFIDMFFLMFRY